MLCKKSMKEMLLVSTLLLSCVSISFAEADGAYCSGVKVISAGAHTDAKVMLGIHTRTDCGTWPPNIPRWFFFDSSDPSNGNAMLATALTAQVAGMKLLLVPKVPGMSEWSTLRQVYTQSN
ncbi:hypothetical protein JWG42_01765 [Desulfoprunum benzoelyticum]|uniref:Uncharacterized protein n=1 Tax=Desulfoprunum benzoelyticum TaxID=1506996 RepID=A0A840UPW0_9BACT|nr:hypothetical protein [Desulfoprunum benzoelyticum]MBB5346593.1 hypothetical protein [Desulfoprunum benzoelyticum]MBM9528878.1 hypothetical protein [Desulfoprunum benzoelyticum]